MLRHPGNKRHRQLGIADICEPVAVGPFDEAVDINRIIKCFHILMGDIITVLTQHITHGLKFFVIFDALVASQDFRQCVDRIQTFPRP